MGTSNRDGVVKWYVIGGERCVHCLGGVSEKSEKSAAIGESADIKSVMGEFFTLVQAGFCRETTAMTGHVVLQRLKVCLAQLGQADGRRAGQLLDDVQEALEEAQAADWIGEECGRAAMVRIRNARRYSRSQEPGAALYEMTQLHNMLKPVTAANRAVAAERAVAAAGNGGTGVLWRLYLKLMGA